jgi:type II restriction enzyme
MIINLPISSSSDLITSHDATRSGFIEIALERNKRGTPFITEARYIRALARTTETPKDLLRIPALERCLLTAAGISDKASQYFTEQDKSDAILYFIENFLEPAGEQYSDELTFRYLLTRGDSLGGIMRNLAGKMGEEKFTTYLLAALRVNQIHYNVWYNINGNYIRDNSGIKETLNAVNIKAIYWLNSGKHRMLIYNTKIPKVKKNIDLSLINYVPSGKDQKVITNAVSFMNSEETSILAFGELKGGIDPAGADEHWKTANTALERIRSAYLLHKPHTFIAAAAIEADMAREMFGQLQRNALSGAANLTKDDQMTALINWIISL